MVEQMLLHCVLHPQRRPTQTIVRPCPVQVELPLVENLMVQKYCRSGNVVTLDY